MSSIIRAALNALLPPGFAWRPKADAGLDQILDGISDSVDNDALPYLNSLADIRNPRKTPIFTDLERNYGLQPNDTISLETRIARLEQRVYQGARVNSIDDVQADLDTAGFDLQVHKNDPPVDPDLFLGGSFQISAGSDYAYAGFNLGGPILAFAGTTASTGEILANTPIYGYFPAYEMQAGGSIAYAGYSATGIGSEAVSGYFNNYRVEYLDYPIPADSNFWSMIWFVGGDATRDPVTGALTAIDQGQVPLNRQDELKEILLAAKSQGAWAVLIITYV
jgi:hypothetical protein